MNVLVWNEFIHERSRDDVAAVYPNGIHEVLRECLAESLGTGVNIRCATLDQPQHGLTDDVIESTDVLLWWGHAGHDQVDDAVVEKLQRRVLEGMGLIVLHSGHESKLFRKLMGTTCLLRWREAGEKERLWITSPGHPILAGIAGEYFELPQAEMYGEHFDIPTPDELLLISWFSGGEVFRSGCTFRRGQGKIFYFRPGHETYPIYFDPNVRRIISNSVVWAAPDATLRSTQQYDLAARHVATPLETLKNQLDD